MTSKATRSSRVGELEAGKFVGDREKEPATK